LQSFGIPYLSPNAPFRTGDMGDHFYRRSWRNMTKRPGLMAERNIVRQKKTKGSKDEESQ
jgi:spore germination protein KA